MASLSRVVKSPWFWLVLMLFAYAATRLVKLTELPIFTDEAIYIRWAQIGAHDPAWRLISLTDGKQPMFTWLVMAALRFIHDPLIAGRIVSVAAGFGSMIGLFALGWLVFGTPAVGLAAAAVYLISPFTLLYDRMALYDSLVATFYIVNTALTVLLVRSLRLDVALLLGMGIGFAVLNKTSGFMSLYFLPLAMVLFDWRKTGLARRLGKFVLLGLTAAAVSQLFYAVLRLSPYLYIVSQKDALFVYPFREWLQHPFTFLWGNLHGLLDWFTYYTTWPIVLAGVLSLVAWRKRWQERLLLAALCAAPIAGLALFGRILYTRYILFMLMPWFVLAADGLVSFGRKFGRRVPVAVTALALIPAAVMSFGILRDIRTAPLHRADRGQYVNDWPAGWGVREIVGYLSDRSRTGKLTVFTEGSFGLMPNALEIYLSGDKNIKIEGLWPLPARMTPELTREASGSAVYLLMYQSQKEPTWIGADKVISVPQGGNDASRMRLYRIGQGGGGI
jgi:4-amino-4-deoxy-L-arabinose transferase-like glycosyltransferase